MFYEAVRISLMIKQCLTDNLCVDLAVWSQELRVYVCVCVHVRVHVCVHVCVCTCVFVHV